jgi:hypothetical protein
MDVMAGLEIAWRITSVATKPVEPATMSFIALDADVERGDGREGMCGNGISYTIQIKDQQKLLSNLEQ